MYVCARVRVYACVYTYSCCLHCHRRVSGFNPNFTVTVRCQCVNLPSVTVPSAPVTPFPLLVTLFCRSTPSSPSCSSPWDHGCTTPPSRPSADASWTSAATTPAPSSRWHENPRELEPPSSDPCGGSLPEIPSP